MNAYFNTLEFKKALSLMGKDPKEAKARYEEYIMKYPNDYSAYIKYASVLIRLGDSKKAAEVLNYVEKTYINDEIFLKEKEKVEYVDTNLVINRLKILSYEERYEEFYKLYQAHKHKIKSSELDIAVFYAQKKLGIEYSETPIHQYIFRQIIEYNEEDFKNHIQKHLIDSTESSEDERSMFVSGFEIDKVIEEVKKYIPSDKSLYTGLYQDTYIFKYDYCGKDGNHITDYFKVVCFHNTNHFITTCPTLNKGNLPFVDINYIKEEKPKQKTLSQIEKFNRRYRSGH